MVSRDTIIAVLSSVGTGIGAWISAVQRTKKTSAEAHKLEAEAESINVATSQDVVRLVNEQLAVLRAEMIADRERCNEQLAKQDRHISTLVTALRRAGIAVPPLD